MKKLVTVIDVKNLTPVQGCLLGLMLGDSLGLPYEGLGPRRIHKMLRSDLRQALVFGRGMVSDDTEHAVMTAKAAALYLHDPERFQKNLAWRLRWWFLRLPAGIGLATGRAIIKLWMGFPPKHSGVFSAGNGPAMRAPILGVLFGHEAALLKRFVRASTELTHRDPKAYIGALAVAHAAYLSSRQQIPDASGFKHSLLALLDDMDQQSIHAISELLDQVIAAEKTGGLDALVETFNVHGGVSGYIYHTLPAVLFVWLKQGHALKPALTEIIRLGGDSDTTGAILGGIVGAGVSDLSDLQSELDTIVDWPLDARSVAQIGAKISAVFEAGQAIGFSWQNGPLIFLRNMIFLLIVLAHGFRRLLPPY